MRPIQRIISVGFATAAILSASVPAISGGLDAQEAEPLAPAPMQLAASHASPSSLDRR